MNSDDITRMAREAGFGSFSDLYAPALERFAALVSAAERKACAAICDERAAKAPMGSDEGCEAEDCAFAIRARGQG